jgi:hypothetical protein
VWRCRKERLGKGGDRMPFKRTGKRILHLKGGKWSVKQTCSSEDNAKKALKLLNMKMASGEIK